MWEKSDRTSARACELSEKYGNNTHVMLCVVKGVKDHSYLDEGEYMPYGKKL